MPYSNFIVAYEVGHARDFSVALAIVKNQAENLADLTYQNLE